VSEQWTTSESSSMYPRFSSPRSSRSSLSCTAGALAVRCACSVMTGRSPSGTLECARSDSERFALADQSLALLLIAGDCLAHRPA
jgi:hypothetical protein